MAKTRKSSPREAESEPKESGDGRPGEGRRSADAAGPGASAPPPADASPAASESREDIPAPSPSPVPDAELVRRAAEGGSDAFEPLVQRYSNTIVRFAYHMLDDFQAAEDIAQESFLKAFSHLRRLADPERFSTWLYSITRHLCLDWIRAKRSMLSVEVLEDDGIQVTDERGPPPDRGIETDELHRAVLNELQDLRADYREILLMKHVYELSYKEIGKMEGLSVSAVGEKLSRVRQMLRKRLADPKPKAPGK